MKFQLSILGFFLLIGLCGNSSAQQNQLSNAHALFKAGRFAEAKAIYQQNIRVPGARSYIHKCNEAIQRGLGKTQTKSNLTTVKIPQIDLDEVPIRDALSFLTRKITEVSGGKVQTNIIFSGTKEQAESTVITLNLSQAPANVVLEYICQVGKCKPRYDKFAVVITPIANITPVAAEPADTGSTPNPPTPFNSNSRSSKSKTDIF